MSITHSEKKGGIFRPYTTNVQEFNFNHWEVVVFERYTKKNSSIFDWCAEHCEGEFSICEHGILFELKEDALICKLTFGGRINE